MLTVNKNNTFLKVRKSINMYFLFLQKPYQMSVGQQQLNFDIFYYSDHPQQCYIYILLFQSKILLYNICLHKSIGMT
jgi:hypothetical protein